MSVEVAHEVLIQNWNRLQEWLNEDREFLLWRQRLTGLLAEWERAQANDEALLRGPLQVEAQKWVDQRSQDLSDKERKFISRSREEIERLKRKETEQQASALKAAQEFARTEAARASQAEKLRLEEQANSALREQLAEEARRRGERELVSARELAAAQKDRAEQAEKRERQEKESRKWLMIALGVFVAAATSVGYFARRSYVSSQNEAEARTSALQAQINGKEKEKEAIRQSGLARQASALEHERAALLEAETVRDALVRSQQLLLESKPQEALARLAATCRLYSKNRLAATSLFAMLAGSNWPLALTPPIHLKTADSLAVERARFSPDGKRIVTTGWDSTGTSKAYVWEAATGELIMEAGPCNSVGEDYGAHFILLPDGKSFTVDGRYLAIAGGGTVSVWDLTARKKCWEKSEARITALQFTPDDSAVLIGTDSGAIIRRSLDQSQEWRADTSGAVEAFSLDGRLALARTDASGTSLRVVTVDTKARPVFKPASVLGTLLAYNSSLTHIIAIHNRTKSPGAEEPGPQQLAYWQPQIDSKPRAIKLGSDSYTPELVHYDAKGELAAIESTTRNNYTQQEQTSVAIFRGEDVSNNGVSHDIVPLNVNDGFYPYDVRFSPDSKLLATVGLDRTARVWDVATGAELHPPLRSQAEFSAVDFSPDGKELLTADTGGAWRIWDLTPTVHPPSDGEPLANEAASFDNVERGRVLVLMTKGGAVSAFDLETGKAVLPPQNTKPIAEFTQGSERPNTDEINSDGSRRLLGDGRTCRLLDPRDGRVLRNDIEIFNGFAHFSPDGRFFLTAQTLDHEGDVRFWNSETGEPLGERVILGRTIDYWPDRAGFSAESDIAWVWMGARGGRLSLVDIATGQIIVRSLELPGFVTAWISNGVLHAVVEEAGQVQLANIPFLLNNAPELLCDLAEAVAARRMRPSGIVEELPVSRDTFRQLSEKLRMAPDNNPFTEWATWLLRDR
jgi:WD40 repeat protein